MKRRYPLLVALGGTVTLGAALLWPSKTPPAATASGPIAASAAPAFVAPAAPVAEQLEIDPAEYEELLVAIYAGGVVVVPSVPTSVSSGDGEPVEREAARRPAPGRGGIRTAEGILRGWDSRPRLVVVAEQPR